jgi:L-alanine-DL-glutamate epimerase-like enolase superfamily enzyme
VTVAIKPTNSERKASLSRELPLAAREPRAASRGTGKATDVRVTRADLFLLPVRTRVPLKFGSETLTSVTCARVRVQVTDRQGRLAYGWGETPLSVQWAWPSELSYAWRHDAMIDFAKQLVPVWGPSDLWGHPCELGHDFQDALLPAVRQQFNQNLKPAQRLPWLAALTSVSAFDIALHDAYGMLHGVPVYDTYNGLWMNRDLSWYLEPADSAQVDFRGKYPQDYFIEPPATRLPAWHLVGGLDLLDAAESNGATHDALPMLLDDWITRDGLNCLKIKLRGNDAAWDYDRIVRVGRIALTRNVRHLSTDFNCTVTEPEYVNEILDRLAIEEPAIYELILYVEQPFPYELDDHPLDVRGVSARKPLFMDESAHDWRQVRLGRALGWTGVALKTCKTQTGALLSLCWAKAHGMDIMVQDLTNPMLAQVPHVLLAAHAGTIMGVETNAMQFYPQASVPEAGIHPGLYARVDGHVDASTIQGPGFGYGGAEAARSLPLPVASSAGEASAVPPWHAKR